MRRHFTASAYVVHRSRVLLHWHDKVRALLPAGGHVEPNEDPVAAALREVREETGLVVELLPRPLPVDVDYPTQIPPPETIMVEDIDDPKDGFHQHIDFIYFCRPSSAAPEPNDGWLWVDEATLSKGGEVSLPGAAAATPPPDVRALALAALAQQG